FAFLAALAQDQEREGASIVDVNFGIEKLLDKDCISAAFNELDRRSSPPVSFDIQGFDFLDAAMREHPGVGLVNSALAMEDHLSPRLGLLKKYGGMLVVLAMEKDIPETAEGRFAAVKRAVEIIGEHGVGLDRVFFDPLVLPAGAGKDWRATLETLRLIKSAGLRSCVGLSNLSFGMPARDGVNAAFLSLCIDEGLGGAIMNTFEETAMKVLRGSLVLRGVDMPEPQSLCENSLVKSIVQGRSDEVFAIVKEELENHDPLHVSQNVLAVAMKEVGTRYSKGSIFLPHLIMAAETVEPVFEYLNGLVGGEGIEKRGKVLLATVEGDIHDIGKKIVATVLRSGMFEVVDLGKDAPAERIVTECAKTKPDVVGLSAMMTTTVGQVKDVADLLRAECIDVPVIAGGASMNADLAERFGVLWGKDAIEALALCGELAKSMKQVNENFPKGEPNEECS
ncbi:MAG: cobalamin-dependent protein, partial [Synergistota bacterium]|nr:cobalamin-dependent protein [Synergistota bacterium]